MRSLPAARNDLRNPYVPVGSGASWRRSAASTIGILKHAHHHLGRLLHRLVVCAHVDHGLRLRVKLPAVSSADLSDPLRADPYRVALGCGELDEFHALPPSSPP